MKYLTNDAEAQEHCTTVCQLEIMTPRVPVTATLLQHYLPATGKDSCSTLLYLLRNNQLKYNRPLPWLFSAKNHSDHKGHDLDPVEEVEHDRLQC